MSLLVPLQTPRLRLGNFSPDDAEALNNMRNDPAVRTYLAQKPLEDLDATRALIQTIRDSNAAGTGLNYAMRMTGDDTLIGFVGMWRIDAENREGEVGYMLAQQYWNRGLAREALGAVMVRADLCLPGYRFVAQVHQAHEASIRMLQRHGFYLAPPDGTEDPDCVRYVRPASEAGV